MEEAQTGERLLTSLELEQRAIQAEQRAIQSEQRVARLEEFLRSHRINPDQVE